MMKPKKSCCHGGDPVVKYAVEWDTAPTFDSALGGAGGPLGSAELQALTPEADAPSAYQEYTIAVPPDAVNTTRWAPYGAAVGGVSTIDPLNAAAPPRRLTSSGPRQAPSLSPLSLPAQPTLPFPPRCL